MAAFFSALLGLINAIPVLTSLVEQFISFYVRSQIDAMKEENRLAIKKAIEEHDQRDLEKALGNPDAGNASNLPGTSIRKSLPGVSDTKTS